MERTCWMWLRSAAFPVAFVAMGFGQGAGQEMAVGVRLGFGSSVMRFEDQNVNDQTEMKPAGHLGVSAAASLKRYLEVEASLLVAQGGFGGRGGHPATLNTLHLELPVVLRVRGPWKISPHFTAGLATRFLLGCHYSEVGMVGDAKCDDPVVGKDWKGVEMAAVTGLGLGWGMGKGFFMVEGLFDWGLSNVNPDPLPPGWAKSADLRVSTAFRLPVR